MELKSYFIRNIQIVYKSFLCFPFYHPFLLGWVCTRHDRHNRWPIIEEENWQDELTEEQLYTAPLGSDSEHTSSDHAFIGDFFVNIPDADSSTTDEDFPYVIDNGNN